MTDSTLSNLGSLYSQMTSTQIAMEAQQSKLNAIKDLFSSDVTYSSNEAVTYTSGSSKSTTNNFYNTINLNSDFTFADSEESLYRLADLVSNPLVDIVKNQKS